MPIESTERRTAHSCEQEGDLGRGLERHVGHHALAAPDLHSTRISISRSYGKRRGINVPPEKKYLQNVRRRG